MKKTFREKWTAHCKKIMKRHPYWKIPMLGLMMAVLSIYYCCLHFVRNGKRFAAISVAALFFMVNSSFSFHNGEVESPEVLQGEEVPLTGNILIDKDSVDILEDEDVLLDGYDDVEFAGIENIDTYTLEDLLEENHGYHEKDRTETPDLMQKVTFKEEDWKLILVNKQHPIPEDYTFSLGTIKGTLQCDERIMDDLLDMMQAAKDAQVDLVICSPYRDYNRQTILFNRKIETYMNKGLSYMDAYKLSCQTVTLPNASEHQLGLAIDFYSSTYMKLNAGFSETETGQWLAEHGHEYGFILRYPLGKEYITGIEFEPWHFRYVGVEAAAVITEKGITLEEFWEDYVE